MNLNKRGGSQKINRKIFENYVNEYKEEIKEEIQILQPDYIIWCAKEIKQKDFIENEFVISMLHPAGGRYIRRNKKELGFEGNVERWDRYYSELEKEPRGTGYLKLSKVQFTRDYTG